jgi:hypothetical protein
MLESSTHPPFSAAFNTPHPVGIHTDGFREVPPTMSEYLEDPYDTL